MSVVERIQAAPDGLWRPTADSASKPSGVMPHDNREDADAARKLGNLRNGIIMLVIIGSVVAAGRGMARKEACSSVQSLSPKERPRRTRLPHPSVEVRF